jgi:excisionase family DNA binding protein
MQVEAGSGRWFTIAEAAPLLGVSVDTVRRRIKRKQLEARQVHTQYGPAWEVCLGDVQGGSPRLPTQDAQGPAESAAILEALRLVDRLQHDNRELAGQVGYLRAQLDAARQTIRALEAPNPQESPITQNLGPISPDPTPEPSEPPSPAPLPPTPNGRGRAPWWRRRWWIWLL